MHNVLGHECIGAVCLRMYRILFFGSLGFLWTEEDKVSGYLTSLGCLADL